MSNMEAKEALMERRKVNPHWPWGSMKLPSNSIIERIVESSEELQELRARCQRKQMSTELRGQGIIHNDDDCEFMMICVSLHNEPSKRERLIELAIKRKSYLTKEDVEKELRTPSFPDLRNYESTYIALRRLNDERLRGLWIYGEPLRGL